MNMNLQQPNCWRDEYSKMLIDSMENGSTVAQFARQIGVSYGTVLKWLKERPSFIEAHEFGRELRRGYLDQLTMEVADGSYAEYNAEGKQVGRKPSASMLQFIMRTSFPEVYNIQNTVKIENVGGELSSMSDENLQAKVNEALMLLKGSGLKGPEMLEIPSGS